MEEISGRGKCHYGVGVAEGAVVNSFGGKPFATRFLFNASRSAFICSAVSVGSGVGVAATVTSVESEHPAQRSAPASKVASAVCFMREIS
jgi:hypothetical protein